MKKLTSFFLVCLFAGQAFSQIKSGSPNQIIFKPATPRGNLKGSENNLQAKSFYKSKADWQTIIDTTWGPGLPLNQKLVVFDSYANAVTKGFAGFNSLGINPSEWNTIKSSYRSRINSSTSKGAFAALMGRFAYNLGELLTFAWDTSVLFTPLNPGTPILMIDAPAGDHFGAVLTVLPDSSIRVLRTIENHPLDLQPGDIILGYEGIPWKDLVNELLGSDIPIAALHNNSENASEYNKLASAGMNWHLFDTIDIVRYTNGDTVHLTVNPLLNLPEPPGRSYWWLCHKGCMTNAAQLPVPGVPFPNHLCNEQQNVFYGIVEGTNIGYIYLYEQGPNTPAQFYNAMDSLSETEGLIIDLRLNYGGWPIPNDGINFLFNTTQYTVGSASIRCKQSDFSLCPVVNDRDYYLVKGNPMSWYDRPLAILTGPNCMHTGTLLAYMLSYRPMVKFFGKYTSASIASNYIVTPPYAGWFFSYNYADVYLINEPGVLINHHEIHVDDTVWFDAESIAAGKDAVAEKAMDWIRDLSYAHNVSANPDYIIPGTGAVTITAKVENPNTHDLSVNVFITSADSIITEIVSLFDDGNHNDGAAGDGTWGAIWPVPDKKTIFSADITTEDITAGTYRTIKGATKFTTIGPVEVDAITYIKSEISGNCAQKLFFKVNLQNHDLTDSAFNVNAKLSCLEPGFANIPDINITFNDIAPGAIATSKSSSFYIAINEDCPANLAIPVKVEVYSDDYTFWTDTISIDVRAPLITVQDDTIAYGDQTDIYISCLQALTGNIYYTYTSAPDNVGAVTGNTSNDSCQWIKVKINDTLNNTTDQMQWVVYTIIPYLLNSDKTIACTGTPITVDIWVLPTNAEDISKPIARIYPNPVKDNLYIKFVDATLSEISISVVDVSGRFIIQRNFEHIDLDAEETLDLSFLKSGIYFLEIRSESNSRVFKVIKE